MKTIKNVVTPYLSLKTSWSNTPTTFDIQWNFQTLARQVPAKAITDYLKSVKDVADNIDWTYDFTYQGARDPPAADPDKAKQQQLIIILLVLSLFVGGPLLVVYRLSRS